MGICFSDTIEPPRQTTKPLPPVKQYEVTTNPNFVPQQAYPVKPSAPPLTYPPPGVQQQQQYTYATMPTTGAYQWATPMYQYNQYAGTGVVPRYVVQQPYYPPQVQQQQPRNVSTGTAVAGGVLGGMMLADMLNDDPY